jgi:hypothetical protein
VIGRGSRASASGVNFFSFGIFDAAKASLILFLLLLHYSRVLLGANCDRHSCDATDQHARTTVAW